jgi:hypothetical protein
VKKIGIGTVLLLLLSGLFYYVYMVHYKHTAYKNNEFKAVLLNTQEKKEFSLFFCDNQKNNHDEKLFLFSVTPAQDCFHVMSQWLLRAWQKRIISAPITCQSVILDQAMTTVFVSFDFPLFNDTMPIHTKIQIINCLLKTIKQIHPSFQSVYLLVRHEPMIDRNIDWIKPFSISGYPFSSF